MRERIAQAAVTATKLEQMQNLCRELQRQNAELRKQQQQQPTSQDVAAAAGAGAAAAAAAADGPTDALDPTEAVPQ